MNIDERRWEYEPQNTGANLFDNFVTKAWQKRHVVKKKTKVLLFTAHVADVQGNACTFRILCCRQCMPVRRAPVNPLQMRGGLNARETVNRNTKVSECYEMRWKHDRKESADGFETARPGKTRESVFSKI